MSLVMFWQLVAVGVACAALGCAPDDFTYGGGTAAPTACDGDECSNPCPERQMKAADGSCVAPCGLTWSASPAVLSPAALLATPSQVYAVGTTGADDGRPARAVVQSAELCTGKLAPAILSLSEQGSSAAAGASFEETLTFIGHDLAQLVFAEHDAETGAAQGVYSVSGLPADAAPRDLSVASSGAWAVGDSAKATWVARLVKGATCSAPLVETGHARAVHALDDTALVVIEEGAEHRLWTLSAAACTPPGCDCQPVQTPIALAPPGMEIDSVHDLTVLGGLALVAGAGRMGGGDAFGLVAAFDASSGAPHAAAKWDPGAGSEAFLALTVLGSELHLGGYRDLPTSGEKGAGRSALASIPLPLESGASPTPTRAVPGLRVIALASNATDAFAIADTGTSTASLVRITPGK